MSIRFKVILPYLLLTLIVAVTGAYVVTRLVANSLSERLSNQLLEAGRVVSNSMARQEIKQVDDARAVVYTRGLAEALNAGDLRQVSDLARPAASSIECVMIFDMDGREALHLLRQTDGTVADVTMRGRASAFHIVEGLLKENDVNSPPRREFGIDPVDGRHYYFTAIPIPMNDQVIGVAVIGTSLNTLLPIMKSSSAADIIFYDESGRAIASTLGAQGMDALFLRTLSIDEEIYNEVISRNNVVTGENFEADGRWYTLARAPLRIGDDLLGVFSVVLPLDFVVESSAVNRTNYTILYSLAMVGVIAIGYFVTRLIINPLSMLVRTSRAIASGDLTKRTGIQSKDEIGVLANTFDEMTANLQQRTLELEETNRILEQMDRTKMRFIQVSAHELRTPLTLVQGYAQMTQMKAVGNKDLEKYANGIQDGTTRMVEIIDSMLDVSRIDSNLLEVTYVETEVRDLIERVQEAFQPALEERGIAFHTKGLSDLPVIQSDENLIYKVFYHVIGNAVKYTPNGGKITVNARTLDNEPGIEIAIQDTGIGIDPQYHELVFEKFFQTGEVLLHSSGKTKFKGGGPGLGLAIARGIVNAHRGRIWLESPGHNEEIYPGTTVYVRLPVDGRNHEND